MPVQTSLTVSGGYYPDNILKYVTGAVAPLHKDWVLCQTRSTEWRYAVGTFDNGVYTDVTIFVITSDTTGYKVSEPSTADLLTVNNSFGYIYYGSGVSDPLYDRSDTYALSTSLAVLVCFCTWLVSRIFRHVS